MVDGNVRRFQGRAIFQLSKLKDRVGGGAEEETESEVVRTSWLR